VTAQVERRGVRYILILGGVHFECMVLSPLGAELQRRMPVKLPPDTSKLVMSPMPGLLTKLTVKVGETVTAGQKLASIEAMKMENALKAVADATVKKIMVKTGQAVEKNQVLIQLV
jgi:propionyl-CoA carboxylase alpha chain